MFMTICALSTGIGASGVAIIRISGPETGFLIKSLTNKALPKAREATLLELNNINNSRPIDQGIVLWFPGPKATQVKIWLNYMCMEAKL